MVETGSWPHGIALSALAQSPWHQPISVAVAHLASWHRLSLVSSTPKAGSFIRQRQKTVAIASISGKRKRQATNVAAKANQRSHRWLIVNL
jgi:hypothetical protein